MNDIVGKKKDETRRRWETVINDKNFDSLRGLPVCETRPEHFDRVLADGKVSTNVYLRRIHNHALGMEWLLKSVIPRLQWPKLIFKSKRAITAEEHAVIIERERNSERRDFYELLWHTGAAQSDGACLLAEDVNWEARTIRFTRKKLRTGQPNPALSLNAQTFYRKKVAPPPVVSWSLNTMAGFDGNYAGNMVSQVAQKGWSMYNQSESFASGLFGAVMNPVEGAVGGTVESVLPKKLSESLSYQASSEYGMSVGDGAIDSFFGLPETGSQQSSPSLNGSLNSPSQQSGSGNAYTPGPMGGKH